MKKLVNIIKISYVGRHYIPRPVSIQYLFEIDNIDKLLLYKVPTILSGTQYSFI